MDKKSSGVPPDNVVQYFEALGRFVHQYAFLEKILGATLQSLAKTDHTTTRAIFHGVRTDAAMGFISRILSVNGSPQQTRDEFQLLFAQLGHITKIRNDILHYGTTFTDSDEYIITNKFRALTEKHVRETPISAATLDQLRHDLRKITAHLVVQVIREVSHDGKFGDDELDQSIEVLLRASWQYKPQRLASHRGTPPSMPPKRQRPPKPSRT